MKFFEKEEARNYLIDFMRIMWRKKGDPLIVGIHTREICERIDKAIYDYDNGKSTYLIISTPPRHGKSDIVSRYLPEYFIGNHPDNDVMLVGYSASLSIGFSKFARSVADTPEYKEIFGKNTGRGSAAADSWQLEGGNGTVTASGLTSGITGKGYHLGVLDDYCASRAEAESEVIRSKTWDSFTDDFLTRRAPVSITIIIATRWHVDDVIGRVKRKIQENNDDYDKDFPKFEVINFPAVDGDVTVNGRNYKYKTLFPERFNEEYYATQFAALGRYSSQALMQGDPQIHGGNFIDTSLIKVHDSISEFPSGSYTRVWDLAHTAKQTQKSDPDWTSGTDLMFRKVSNIWELWIKDVSHFRKEGLARDTMIRAVTDKDGHYVTQAIEQSLDSVDFTKVLREVLRGKYGVRGISTKGFGDKVARMTPVVPIFEAGNVHILRAPWNADWINELDQFPAGAHDDQVDNISAGYIYYNSGQGTATISHTQY